MLKHLKITIMLKLANKSYQLVNCSEEGRNVKLRNLEKNLLKENFYNSITHKLSEKTNNSKQNQNITNFVQLSYQKY